MKQLWVKADLDWEWDKRKELVTTALESGAQAVLVGKGESEKVRELGKIRVVSSDEDSDIFISNDIEELKKLKKVKIEKAFYKEIKSKEDEKEVTAAGGNVDYVVIKAADWKIIPLENIIASLKDKCKIIMEVTNKEDAKLALETLELGTDGVLVNADSSEIKKIKELIDEISTEKIELTTVKITQVKPVGMGDRVCVDTCSMFNIGEGMLVGSQSNALFLVHSETIESPYVATRPFRVNAGPVHAYTRMPDGSTKYLSELSAGDEVLAVDWKGNTRSMVIGRLKIEKRPLILVEAEFNGKTIKTLLQNAETIRLVDKEGNAISVTELKEEDEILVYIEEVGRHFGMAVDESIEER
ncbi:MAG: 3-dehydroquinate synthase II [Candidatus Altiarchaeales archaeon]|nr:MAG: 3-dehydroquinate synthase II [Candidatus Altiarchaeales archaeon]HDI72847.1 3-dehydroquinate synthase II [Candidatus Altiarchaeales archaeon]